MIPFRFPTPLSVNSDFRQSIQPWQHNATSSIPRWPLFNPQPNSSEPYLAFPRFRMDGTHLPNANTVFDSDQREKWADATYLEDFMRGCRQNQMSRRTSLREKTMKLSDVKEMHAEAYAILEGLENLSTCDPETEGERRKLKLKLSNILSNLNIESGASLGVQVRRRVRRRIQFRRRRKKLDEAVDKRGSGVNIWLQKRQLVDNDEKRDEQVRKELEDYMHQNSRLLTNLHKYLQLLSALAKLRKHRLSSLTREALDMTNEMFLNVHRSTKNYLLTAIASTEQERSKLQMYTGKGQEKTTETTKCKMKLGDLPVAHSVQQSELLHERAGGDFLTSVNTRQQWDQFLSDSGSCIPKFFVVPPLSPRQEWASYKDTSAVHKE